MAERINWEVIVEAQALHFDTAERALTSLQGLVSTLGDKSIISDRQLKTLTGTITKMGGALSQSSGSMDKHIAQFNKMSADVKELTGELREAAQTMVSLGNTEPVTFLARDMDVQAAREILAVIEAEGVTAAQVARRVVAEEERKIAARQEAVERASKQTALYNQYLYEEAKAHAVVAKAAEDAAKRVSKVAQQENAAAARQQTSARPGSVFAQGQAYDTGSAMKASETSWAREAKAVQDLNLKYDAHVQTYNKVLDQKSRASQQTALYNQYLYEEERASKQAAEATKRHQSNLITLRYALYDVSNSLGIMGAGMLAFSTLAFKASADYERAFADVIRTNDSLMQSQVLAERTYRSFMDLAGSIPVAFGDLSAIGKLAGQLGVASGNLEAFVQTVAQFSAVTGESIDTTATAFGRLDALLPDIQGNYDALASSILNVGINSVATEGQIISVSTQLAGIGNQAGLTADEVVGLAGALASVGVQPELARGTITRLFGQISRAVATGGENLQNFAAIAGTSADQFSAKWNSSPMQATLDFFRGIQQRGGEAEAALRAVGITSVRDVPAILRLSQSMDSVLVPALADASAGLSEGTQLSDNYGVISETLASKLQILANDFQSLMATLGESAIVFKGVIDILSDFLTWLRKIQENPITAFLSQAAVLVTALGGVLLLLVAGLGRVGAGMLAFRTAMQDAGIQATGLRAALVQLGAAISGVNAQSVAASGNVGKLSGAMGALNAISGLLIAVPIVNWVKNLSSEINGAVVDVDTLTKSLQTLDTNMSSVAQKDFDEVLRKSLESLGASTKTITWGDILPNPGNFDIGLAEALASEYDLGLQRLTEKTTSWWTTNFVTGEPSWMAGLFDNSFEQIDKFEESFIQAWESATTATQQQGIIDALNQLQEGMSTEEIENFRYNFADLYEVIGSGVDQSLLFAESQQAMASEIQSTTDSMTSLIDEVFAGVNAQYALYGALYDVGDALVQEGAAAAFTGDAFQKAIQTIVTQSGSSGVAAANLQVLFDTMVSGGYASASQLQYLTQVIAGLQAQAGGKVSAPTMTPIDFAGFQKGVQQARASMGSLGGGARKAAGDVRKAKEEVRTLLDYANDLSSVWGRAFDIRFSAQSTLDDITSSWIDMTDSIADAREETTDITNDINGLNASIQSLTADRALQEYFLSVAEAYGDALKAQEIRANLAEIDAELADKSQDLTNANKKLQKAQDKASTSLSGNSESAIENRKSLTDLVKQYQDHLRALAESGVSQGALQAESSRLRQEFIDQAKALGFSESELQNYAAAFDDVSKIIANTNFGVTIDLTGLDPALLALREFAAKAKKDLDSIGSGVGGGVAGGIDAAMPEMQAAAVRAGIVVDEELRKAFIGSNLLKMPTDVSAALYDGLMAGTMTVEQVSAALGYKSTDEFIAANAKFLPTSMQKNLQDAGYQTIPYAFGTGATLGKESVKGNSQSLGAFEFRKPIANAGNNALGTASAAGSSLGATVGSNTTSSAGNNMNIPGVVANNISAARVPAMNNAWSIGSAIASSVRSGLSAALDWVLGPNTVPRRTLRAAIGFAEGGYTGSGGMYQPAGIVHKGEYVIPKRDVNQSTGMPHADALGRLLHGVRGYANGGYVTSPSVVVSGRPSNAGGGVMMVELSPTDRALLRSAGGSGDVILYANNEAIARSANEGNRNIVAMGGRP